MTLCVAVACQEKKKPRIVIGTDWEETGHVARAQIADKFYWLTRNVVALISGGISRAIELTNTYAQCFASCPVEDLNERDVSDIFKAPLIVHKQKLVNEYVGLKFGLDYERFRNAVALGQIPQDLATRTFGEIEDLEIGCDLIACFFARDDGGRIKPQLLRVGDTFEHCENFAAVGSGAFIASGVLYQRSHSADDPLGKAVYHVYEAMDLGSIAPGVGDEWSINILYPPGEKDDGIYTARVSDRGMDFLGRQWRGPQSFKRFVKLPDYMFEKETFW
jgi:hypothetical protein